MFPVFVENRLYTRTANGVNDLPAMQGILKLVGKIHSMLRNLGYGANNHSGIYTNTATKPNSSDSRAGQRPSPVAPIKSPVAPIRKIRFFGKYIVITWTGRLNYNTFELLDFSHKHFEHLVVKLVPTIFCWCKEILRRRHDAYPEPMFIFLD